MTVSMGRTMSHSDHTTLASLNRDYINAIQHSDVRRFDEELAPEFYCSNPDGSLVDRAGVLRQPVARNSAAYCAIRNRDAKRRVTRR